MSTTETTEQLRRLKNTVMGAGHRLSLLARSKDFRPDEALALGAVAGGLSAAAQRLEHILTALRRRA